MRIRTAFLCAFGAQHHSFPNSHPHRYTGADCSQRMCPAGRAWADYALGYNVAHRNDTECSGYVDAQVHTRLRLASIYLTMPCPSLLRMGYCDYETGICNCRSGFGGSACQMLKCPRGTDGAGNSVECSGQGRCMSMREAGAQIDYKVRPHSPKPLSLASHLVLLSIHSPV